jgi:endonuclease/exonuclease/phosphatase family metal-dependent hydrolase
MRRLYIGLAVIAAFALYVAAFLMINHGVAAKASDIERKPAAELQAAGDTIDVLTWNLGYAGLGAGSDFIADGGTHYFPPSWQASRDNVAGIVAFLETQRDADVILLEELAARSPVNYWADLRGSVDRTLSDHERIFFADFKTRLMPFPLRMSHGQGIYAQRAVESVDVVPLPAEDEGIFGVRRRYAATVARLPIEGGGEWTIASVHLAAFDDDALVRTEQMRQLLAWAEGEYRAGRHVVLGGDWNLQLAETNFAHTTEERFLFWLYPFPRDALPEGWSIAADASIPSVRTNERPYRRGENYTTVIDGFIISPNVVAESVHGFDLDFQHSDHQPVRGRFRAVR